MNTSMTQTTPIFIYTHLNLISIHSRGRGFAFPLHNPINYEKTKKKAQENGKIYDNYNGIEYINKLFRYRFKHKYKNILASIIEGRDMPKNIIQALEINIRNR